MLNVYFRETTVRMAKLKCTDTNLNDIFVVNDTSVIVYASTSSINSTTGAFIVYGDVSIASTSGNALRINGSSIPVTHSIHTTIGSHIGTGTKNLTIPTPTTFGSTNYTILGSVSSTSGTFNVAFSNKTTVSFNANVSRSDALFAGWTDSSSTLDCIMYA